MLLLLSCRHILQNSQDSISDMLVEIICHISPERTFIILASHVLLKCELQLNTKEDDEKHSFNCYEHCFALAMRANHFNIERGRHMNVLSRRMNEGSLFNLTS